MTNPASPFAAGGHANIRNILLVDVPRVPFVEPNSAYAEVNRQKSEWEQFTYSESYARQIQGRQYGYGLLSIASFIKDLDVNIEYTDLDALSEDFDPMKFEVADAVLIGLLFCIAEPTVIELAKKIRRLNSEAIIVVGGHHATYRARYLMEHVPEIDMVVRKEGEQPIRQFIAYPHERHRIPGTLVRRDGAVVSNGLPRVLKSRDIPAPDYDILNRPLDEYGLRMITQRGCAKPQSGSCLFCSEKKFFARVRSRTDASVMAELEYLKKNINRQPAHIHIADSIFPGNVERTVRLCKQMERFKNSFEFSANLYAPSINERVLETLRRANFARLFVGLEDPSETVLRRINKGIHFSDVIGALKMIKSFGFNTSVYTIYGLPGSTVDSLKKHTEEIAGLVERRLADEVFDAMYVPVPGTDPYNNPEKYGIEILESDWLKYYREDGPIFGLDGVSASQLREGYHEFKKAIEQAYRTKHS